MWIPVIPCTVHAFLYDSLDQITIEFISDINTMMHSLSLFYLSYIDTQEIIFTPTRAHQFNARDGPVKDTYISSSFVTSFPVFST